MLYLYIIGQIITTTIAIILIIYLIQKMNKPDPINRQMFSVLESRVQGIEDTITNLQKTEPETKYKINSIIVLDGDGIVPDQVIKLAYRQGIAFIRLNEYYSTLEMMIGRMESGNTGIFNMDALTPVKQSDGQYLLRSQQVTISLNRWYPVTSVWSESMINLIAHNIEHHDDVQTIQKVKRTLYAHRGDRYQNIRSAALRETTEANIKYARYANIINSLFFPYYYMADQ